MSMIPGIRCLSVLLLIGVTRAEETPEKVKDTKEAVVAIEASSGIRKSLQAAKHLRLNEGLPDPVRYPDLHKSERQFVTEELLMQPEIVAGHSFYSGDRSFAQDILEPIRAVLCASGSFDSLTDDKTTTAFYPVQMLSWKASGVDQHALISLDSEEVLFVGGKTRTRLTLVPSAHAILKKELAYHRYLRPDALEEAKKILSTLTEDTAITVIQGFPRDGSGPRSPELETYKQESARRGETKIAGYQFFNTGTLTPDTKPLREIILKDSTLKQWGGGKACGGFHPDFAIRWGSGDTEITLLICFGCHESKFITNSGSLIYDLGKEGYEALKAELDRYSPPPERAAR